MEKCIDFVVGRNGDSYVLCTYTHVCTHTRTHIHTHTHTHYFVRR